MNIVDFYLPHAHCVLNDQRVIIPDLVGNALTVMAYFLAGAALVQGVFRFRRLLLWSERLMFLHAAGFIVTCGCTHALQMWNWWHTDYQLAAWINVANGVISLSFSILLIRYFYHRLKD